MKTILSILMLALAASDMNAAKPQLKPRIVVFTDIAPADIEPDDMESMVHLLTYADQLEIEGLVTSVGWNCDPYPKEWQQYLYQVVDAYSKDVKNLMKRSNQKGFLPLKKENDKQYIGYWPSAEYLRSRIAMGSINGGIKSIGKDNNSDGSELLIRLASEPDDRPIYLAAWGGANTLAQAIWKVKQTCTSAQLEKFIRKFRIYTITDQDMHYNMRMNRAYSSHMWLRRDYANLLQFVWDEGAWQEQCELGKQFWTDHVSGIQQKGELGKVYPNYKWGVEGDTPSFLYVLPNGLNDPEHPEQAGWAGYHKRGLSPDSLTTAWNSWQEPTRRSSVNYKRNYYKDELNDQLARMQWADEGKGNHNPVIIINGNKGYKSIEAKAKPGATITLATKGSYDPDKDIISYKWYQQPEIGHTKCTISELQGKVMIAIPANATQDEIHIICEAHDNGSFHLASYRRIIIKII